MSITPTSVVQTNAITRPAALKDKLLPALMACGLGAVLLFGAGFASMEALHNAAHDSRHSAGFPCH
jgi:cobalt transporter subunit CbtB